MNVQNQPQAMTAAMRRNLLLLTLCQAIAQSGNVIMLSITALSVIGFFPYREMATLPATLQHFGVMLGVFPASALMMRMGRGFGFRVGSLFGMAGAAFGGWGLYSADFLMMCLGGLVLGYSIANLNLYRFAAVELVPFSYRARAIAWVTAGGVLAASIGPLVVRTTFDSMAPIYLGCYLAMIGIHAVVFMLMGFVDFPPVQRQARAEGPVRPMLTIARQPRYAASVIAGTAAWAAMMFLMSSSPLAIVGCGLPPTEPPFVIFLHATSMYVPSFFTGHLIGRFGTERIMALGCAILLACVVVAVSGMTVWHFRLALMLNGIGWNFLFVGATALITTCYRPSERGKAQAFNDFMIFGTTACASFLAGVLQERIGWTALNLLSVVLVGLACGAVAWLALQRQREAAVV